MTIQKYSTSIIPVYGYSIESRFKTLISDFDDGKEQRNRQYRFPKRTVHLPYKILSTQERNTLHDFYRDRYGASKEFWFIDFQSREWGDEFIGYGGPLNLDAQYYYKGSSYVDQTDHAMTSATDDVLLVPATDSTAGDCNYFGGDSRFDRVVITITTAGSHGCTGAWEFYSSTGGWASATVTTDQTNCFTAATGSKNVDFTPSTNWQDYEVNGVNKYWLRFRVTTTSSANVQPKASQVQTYSKSFDVPCIMASSTSLIIYENGTSTTFTMTSGNGGGGVDTVSLSSYPTAGSLITGDFKGNLRLKSRMDDKFAEEIPFKDRYNLVIDLTEIR